MSAPTIQSAAAHFQAGRLEEAARDCEAVLQAEPQHAPALNLLGIIAGISGRREESAELFGRALRVKPDNANYHSNLAAVLSRLGRDAEALASCDAALALEPRHASALSNRAVALAELGRPEEALVSCEAALVLDPEFADAHFARGRILQTLGRHRESLASLERALALKPGLENLRMLVAMARLRLGDYARGWEEHEGRWQAEELAKFRRKFAQPLWLGKEDVRGRKILLYAEQGLGDTLQFVRYAPLLAARGARVILEVQPPLVSVLSSVAGIERVCAWGKAPPVFDLQCPLMSLPLAFGTRLDSVPASVPYIHASPAAQRKWEARLGPASGMRIGIAWSGNAAYKEDRHRSLPLASLLWLQDAGAELVSLQKDLRPADADAFAANGRMLHFGADFADTAALISHMDLVISVDTSIAHLAGAMGKPVWILLTCNPDSRWLCERNDSPWYPTARLFRQPKAGDWDSVLASMRRELKAWRG